MQSETVRAEVERCHHAFADWIAGRVGREAGFERALCGRLDPEGTYVTISGKVRTLGDLLDDLRDAGGVNPDFAVQTGDVRIIDATPERVVVLYEEHGQGAKQSTPSHYTRWVTAVLVRDESAPGGFRWTHIHEVQRVG